MTSLLRPAARVAAFMLTFFCAAFAASALAQSYPSKPAKLIVGFPPGGGSDELARLVAAALTEKFGQQIIGDNNARPETIVATQFVQSQHADGYTLLFVSAAVPLNQTLHQLTLHIQHVFK